MSEAFRWWLVLQLVGIPLLPLCLALFRRLPDRGYALSKPFGLIFLGYTFWLLNSLHILPNSGRGILAALVLLAAISGVFVYRERDDLLEWIHEHWQYIVGVEVLFLIVFAVAVWLRSMVGNISGTEQPMDLMFINAATRADHFPPKDPWLSGHTVAYYYFGYLMVAMSGRLAGVDTEIGYNIGLAMIAAMALVGAAGIVYNLVAMRESATETADPAPKTQLPLPFNWRPPAFGLAGGLMLVIMGNLVWVFQFMSAYGIGGKGFYDWVDVSGLKAGAAKHAWYPSDFFAFFDASRIYRLDDKDFRAITEFPMFSFLLGDLHPHVMALPFVLLVVALALTLFRSREPLDVTFWLQRPLALVAAAILVGGLAFLNTWDIATMAFVVVAAAFVSNFTRVRAITGDLVRAGGVVRAAAAGPGDRAVSAVLHELHVAGRRDRRGRVEPRHHCAGDAAVPPVPVLGAAVRRRDPVRAGAAAAAARACDADDGGDRSGSGGGRRDRVGAGVRVRADDRQQEAGRFAGRPVRADRRPRQCVADGDLSRRRACGGAACVVAGADGGWRRAACDAGGASPASRERCRAARSARACSSCSRSFVRRCC